MAVQTAPEMLTAVSSVAAFRDLSPASREAIAGISSLRHYRKDMYVFIEGDDAEFLCFLHEGTVRTFRTTVLGAEQTLQLVRPGELFALTGFLHPRDAYPSTAQTVTEAWIGFVRNDALRGRRLGVAPGLRRARARAVPADGRTDEPRRLRKDRLDAPAPRGARGRRAAGPALHPSRARAARRLLPGDRHARPAGVPRGPQRRTDGRRLPDRTSRKTADVRQLT
jgi:CRP-like cAMP-binding protein